MKEIKIALSEENWKELYHLIDHARQLARMSMSHCKPIEDYAKLKDRRDKLEQIQGAIGMKLQDERIEI